MNVFKKCQNLHRCRCFASLATMAIYVTYSVKKITVDSWSEALAACQFVWLPTVGPDFKERGRKGWLAGSTCVSGILLPHSLLGVHMTHTHTHTLPRVLLWLRQEAPAVHINNSPNTHTHKVFFFRQTSLQTLCITHCTHYTNHHFLRRNC